MSDERMISVKPLVLEKALRDAGLLRFDTDSHVVELRALLDANQEDYPPCDYCGIVPSYHPWHGSGALAGVENPHIHACNECRHLLPAALPQGEPVAYDPEKENKLFEAWARTQSSVSLQLCDIGLYYQRDTGLAHDAWQYRAKLAEQPAPVAVAYQYRQRPLWRKDDNSGWMPWQDCSQETHADYTASPDLHDWQYETRTLYVGPNQQ